MNKKLRLAAIVLLMTLILAGVLSFANYLPSRALLLVGGSAVFIGLGLYFLNSKSSMKSRVTKAMLGLGVLGLLVVGLGALFTQSVGLLPGTAVVIASDTPATTRAQAILVKGFYGNRVQICDGVADDVQIQAAITADGVVHLTKGSFAIAASIVLGSTDSQELHGEGWATRLYPTADMTQIIKLNATNPGSFTGVVVKDLSIDGLIASRIITYGIYGKGLSRPLIEHVFIHDVSGGGIYIASDISYPNYGLWITRNWIVTGNGIGLMVGSPGAYTEGAIVSDNLVSGWGDNGLRVFGGFATVIGNNIDGCNASTPYGGASLDIEAQTSTVTGGIVSGAGATAILVACHSSIITGVIVQNSSLGINSRCNTVVFQNCNNVSMSNCSFEATAANKANYLVWQGSSTNITFRDNNIAAGSTNNGILAPIGTLDYTVSAFADGLPRVENNQGFINSGEVRTVSGSLVKTGRTLTDGTGTFTGSPITLLPGLNTVACTVAGTATIVLPAGSTGTAATGTMTVDLSPVALVAGSNVITTSGPIGNILVTINSWTFAIRNPEAQDCLIESVTIEITTAGGTALSVCAVGIGDDAYGTGLGAEFFTAIPMNTPAVYSSYVAGDTGAQTKPIVWQDNASATDSWIVGQISTQIANNLVAKYYITYRGR